MTDTLKTSRTAKTSRDIPQVLRLQIDAVKRYWINKCVNGSLPLRSDIEPANLQEVVSKAFIIEKLAPGIARFRMAGTHLNDLMGMEVRGMPITSFLVPEDRMRMADALVDLFETPASLTLYLHSAGNPDAPALQGVLILLPLKSDLGDTSRALGCFLTEGQIGIGPRRFEIQTSAIEAIRPIETPALKLIQNDDVEIHEYPSQPRRGVRPYLQLVKD
ncbi:PAS domain protein [Roseovarius albus]|uniref:PAS domain protein n=1 Tax=Roseovarius albus TaxID=1247867 RepID=A0A1X6Z012_9RHOB|nr:PAS domain-containing protein [Roseovarius albus]SLN36153.1 PAS domain protein [Roseovarius albus]